MSPTPPVGLTNSPVHLGLIDDRQRNLEADAIDGQQQQREEDLLPQLGNREDDADFFPHGSLRPLRVSWYGSSVMLGRAGSCSRSATADVD